MSQPFSARSGIVMLAVGLMAACLGGLAAGVGLGGDSTTPVVVLARTVLQGDVIEAGDLAVADVSAPGAQLVPATQRENVVGSRALATLLAGSLLAPDGFGQPQLKDNTTQVSLRLGPSQLPDCPLPGGLRVLLIALPSADHPDDVPLVFTGHVVFPPVEQIDGTMVLDVAVATSDVSQLAQYLLDARVSVVTA